MLNDPNDCMTSMVLSHPNGLLSGSVSLPASKSISNRVLIIKALSRASIDIQNLSTSDDTAILEHLLLQHVPHYDVGHAGTAMRFLTAYLAFQIGDQTLTGSERMCQRPIGPLVDALNLMGANIEYLEENGYPPIKLHSPLEQNKSDVTIDASVSSQFISALLMVAPTLPLGLRLHLEGNSVSWPYIEMTLSLMEQFGINHIHKENTISIGNQTYQGGIINIEGDWSAAGFYYAMVALSDHGSIVLKGLHDTSLQGDNAAMEIFKDFGVVTTKVDDGLLLTKDQKMVKPSLEVDISHVPDLAQCISVAAAGLGISLTMKGIETLFIKETDRMFALKTELAKVGVEIHYSATESRQIGKAIFRDDVTFETYGDHRMAMALSCLALIYPISIQNPEVVSKSYPGFWDDLKILSFEMSEKV